GSPGDDLIIHHKSSPSTHDEGAKNPESTEYEHTNTDIRPPRTQNRVRFDITDDDDDNDDGDVEAHGQSGAGRGTNWVNEDDYLDDDDGRIHSESHQSAPLLTNIEAPSVTVATSSALSPEDAPEDSHSKSGLGSAFMNMANSIIGAGIIGQPYAIRQAGLLTGIVLLVALTVIVDWTIRLIVINSKLSGADSFQATVERCYGRPGLIAISVAQWLAKASAMALGFRVPAEARGDYKGYLIINSGLTQAIGVISFAFVCHHNSLLIYDSLKKPTLNRFTLVTHYSTGISMCFCIVMALGGFLTFGSKTEGNVLNNFPSDNFVVNVARLWVDPWNLSQICFGLNMLATLPLEAFVCRSVIETFYFPDEPYNPNRHLLFTTSLVVASVVMALFTCDLGSVFELIGSTSAAALAYILPPLCFIKLSQKSTKAKIPAYLCIGFGSVVMAISVLKAVVDMFNDNGGAKMCLS
ncbi:hypothetical protein KEM56_002338, partial [Ascosphaera pollenicola]